MSVNRQSLIVNGTTKTPKTRRIALRKHRLAIIGHRLAVPDSRIIFIPMKQLLLMVLVAAAVFSGCGQQEKKAKETETVLYNKEFDWMIAIPAGFDSMTKEEVRIMQGRGVKAMEDTYDIDIEQKGGTIFAYKNGLTNLFHSNWQPFDSADGNYEDGYRAVNNMIYRTFETQIPGAKLDSSSSTEKISGMEFKVFKVEINLPNNPALDCWYFRRLFGRKELLVNITSSDQEHGTALLKAWRSSNFRAGKR